MRGKRHNIYASAEQEQLLAANGVTAQDAFDVGVLTLAPAAVAAARQRESVAGGDCPHPKARRDGKNPDLCRACGTVVR